MSSVVQDISADELCSFFASNFQPPVFSFPNIDHLPSQTLQLNVEEVARHLSKLKRKSAGPDGLPYWVFRDCRFALAPAITILFNRCLMLCHVPTCLKVANVSPIPKCDKPSQVNDFRPISMLPLLSKLFERIFSAKWLIPGIRDKLNCSQFAYVPGSGKGTVMAVTSMYLHVLKYLDIDSGAVRIAAIDLSKAFDSITHDSIINACIRFNLSKDVTLWIKSYFSDRRQRVSLNGTYTEWKSVTSGVPQGSVIGPILFCLVVDSLKPLCDNSIFIKYADDLTILHFIRNDSDDNLQTEIDNVLQWCNDKSLSVNVTKSCVMDCVTKKSLSCRYVDSFKNVSCIKILGCFLSCDFKWNKHVEYVIKKASKRIYLMLSLKRAGCPPDLLFNVYVTCIWPILLYPFPAFCNIPQYLKRRIISVENRVFKIIGQSDDCPISLFAAADQMCVTLFNKVVADSLHPLRRFFDERRVSHLRNTCPLKNPRQRHGAF